VSCHGDNPDTKLSIAQVAGPTVSSTGSTLRPLAKDRKTIIWPAKPSLFHDSRCFVDAALAVIILGLAVWISVHHRASACIDDFPRVTASSPLPKPSATIFSKGRGSTQKASGRTASASRARFPFKRVRVGPHEVDYIAEGVKIRHFTIRAAAPHAPALNKQFDIGDDVTVRIFTDAPAIAPNTTTVSRR